MSHQPQYKVQDNHTYRSLERAPLVDPNVAEVMGQQMVLDDETWHYVLIWAELMVDKESEFEEPQPDPIETAQKFFTKRAWEGSANDRKAGVVPASELFRANMTKVEFHNSIREAVVGILAGPKFGFKLGTISSIDEDEIFLLVELPNGSEALSQIANRQEVRMAIKPELYDPIGSICPTLKYNTSTRQFEAEDDSQLCPMHLPFKRLHAKKFQDFGDVDILRVIRNRMREFLNLRAMVREGYLIDFFPVHRWKELQKLESTNWSSGNICQTLSLRDPRDMLVRDYFGEEVAFFFHWFNFYTYSLVVPAVIVCAIEVAGFVYPELFKYFRMGFAFFMCLWSAVFTKTYSQRANLRIEQWGMRNWEFKATVRPSFKENLEDSWTEFFQNSLHWVLVAVFMLETVSMMGFVSWIRAAALDEPDADWNLILFTAKGSLVAQMAKVIIAGNSKVVDMMWLKLSPALTLKENWKTEQDKKYQMQTKLFLVKFVVNYYPFFYIAFMKRYVENIESEECVEELRENLLFFFVSHVLIELLQVGMAMFFTRRAITHEIGKVREKRPDAEYTYLQFQAKCPKYEDDTEDMMELITSLGFVMMFSSVAPGMVVLALGSNLVEMRLTAYRMCNVMRRAEPQGQEGIGAWAPIIQAVSSLGVISNVAIAVFDFHPFNQLEYVEQVVCFVLIEHALLGLKNLVEYIVPEQNRTLKRIQGVNHDCMDEIFDYSFKSLVEVEESEQDEHNALRRLEAVELKKEQRCSAEPPDIKMMKSSERLSRPISYFQSTKVRMSVVE